MMYKADFNIGKTNKYSLPSVKKEEEYTWIIFGYYAVRIPNRYMYIDTSRLHEIKHIEFPEPSEDINIVSMEAECKVRFDNGMLMDGKLIHDIGYRIYDMKYKMISQYMVGVYLEDEFVGVVMRIKENK